MINNQRPLLLGLLFVFLAGCAHHGPITSPSEINHIVMIWLKEPGNAAHRQSVIAASEQLREIPGIKTLRIGEVRPSDRAIVDDSFDVGVYMLFADQAAMETYTAHPSHKAIVKNQVAPLAKKIIIYDF